LNYKSYLNQYDSIFDNAKYRHSKEIFVVIKVIFLKNHTHTHTHTHTNLE